MPWQLIQTAFACIIIACFTCTFLNYTIFGMFIVFVWLNGISYLIEIPYHFPNLIKHNLIDRAYWSDLVEFNRYKYAGLSSIMLPRLMKSIKTGIFVCVFNNIDSILDILECGVIVIILSTSLKICAFFFSSWFNWMIPLHLLVLNMIYSLIGIRTSVWPLPQIFIQQPVRSWICTLYMYMYVHLQIGQYLFGVFLPLHVIFFSLLLLHKIVSGYTMKSEEEGKNKMLMFDKWPIYGDIQLIFLTQNLHSLNNQSRRFYFLQLISIKFVAKVNIFKLLLNLIWVVNIFNRNTGI